MLPLEQVQHLSGKPLSDINLALAYYYSGDTRRGEVVLEGMSGAPSAASSQRARAWLAAFLAARGQRSRASSMVGQVTAGGYMDHHVAAGLGSAYAQLGRPEEALKWLRNAANHGFPCPPWYTRDPLLRANATTSCLRNLSLASCSRGFARTTNVISATDGSRESVGIRISCHSG